MSEAIEKLHKEHRSSRTGRFYRDKKLIVTGKETGEMTHAEWKCSCGVVSIGTGAVGEHQRVALRNIRRELKRQATNVR